MEASSKKILIIEDHDDIRESTAEILELSGYEVITAPEGKTGVALATEHLPDLILCDIMMPELDGFGVLFMLSKSIHTQNIPFIFLTAKSERSDVRKAMEMGADDYLIKPFDDVELLAAIESRFKKRNQLSKSQTLQYSASLSGNISNSENILEELIQNSRNKHFRKKHLVYQENDTPYFVYYIKKGKVRSYRYYVDGRELSTGIFVENQFFGYESILLQEKYKDNVETLEEAEIIQIPKDDFYELIFRKPDIARQFFKMISGNVVEKEEKLLGFAYDTVRKRVANTLVSLAEKMNSASSETSITDYVIRMSRDDLASLAGTANETISRMLSDFKDEKLITKEGNAIRVLDLEKLKNLKS